MLSTLLLQTPAPDVLENPTGTPGTVLREQTGPAPQAFASALLAAAARVIPGQGVDPADASALEGTIESAVAPVQPDAALEPQTPPQILAQTLPQTQTPRAQRVNLGWTVPALANSAVSTEATPSANHDVYGSLLPLQLPSSGSVLPADVSVDAAASRADASIGTANATINVGFQQPGMSETPQTAIPTGNAGGPVPTPVLTSSLTLASAPPVPTQPDAVPRTEARAVNLAQPVRSPDEPEPTLQSTAEFETANSSMGQQRPESRHQRPAIPAIPLEVRALAAPTTNVATLSQQMSGGGESALMKAPVPALSAGERTITREPLAARGTNLEAISFTRQTAELQGTSVAGIPIATTNLAPATATAIANADGSVLAAQMTISNGPMDGSISSTTALEKPTEGAATQLRVLTLAHSDELGDKLGALLASIKHIGKSQLSIQLQPQELGRLEIRIAPGAEQALNVSISTQHSATRDLVEAHLHRLRSALDDQGYADVHVEVGQDRDSAAGRQRSNTQEQPSWPLTGATGRPLHSAFVADESSLGVAPGQIAALRPGIDAYV